MKATGIVRRIDDLGRIIIPKEIRATMGIKEGDPFELFTDSDGVYFKKYIPDLLENALEVIKDIVDQPPAGLSYYDFTKEQKDKLKKKVKEIQAIIKTEK